MKLSSEHLILALQLINSNGNLNIFFDLDYSYMQISELTAYLRKNKFVEFKKGDLILTREGFELIQSLNKELNRSGIEKFISPLLQYKTEKSGLFDIYIPILKE